MNRDPLDRFLAKRRTWLRRQVGVRTSTVPVEVLGNFAPALYGRRYYYTTPNGTYCPYPNAYRKAFGRPVYQPSTLVVRVGERWLAKHDPWRLAVELQLMLDLPLKRITL